MWCLSLCNCRVRRKRANFSPSAKVQNSKEDCALQMCRLWSSRRWNYFIFQCAEQVTSSPSLRIVPAVQFLGVFSFAIIHQDVVLLFLRTRLTAIHWLVWAVDSNIQHRGLRMSRAAESKSSEAALCKQPLTLEHYPLTCDRWRRCHSSQLDLASGARRHPLSPPWTNIIILARPTQTNTV